MKFSFAKVTNSRLMGNMGLIIGWEDKNEWREVMTIYQFVIKEDEE